MILEQLGMLAEASALATANTAKASYCLDLASAYNRLGNTKNLWLVIKVTTLGTSSNSDGTFQFFLRNGDTSNGTDISGGNTRDVPLTEAIAEGDARVAAGAYLLRIQLPKEIIYRYLQVWKTFGGTSPTISVDISISPSEPPSDYNIQAHPASPMSPP